MSMPDTVTEDPSGGAQQALQIAFQTMQERCQQLQKRLSTVEEENMTLRVERRVSCSDTLTRENGSNEKSALQSLEKKVEELTKQKSQLTNHVFMVAAENRQLWSRLTRLTRTNKSLGNQLIKISNTLKQHPTTQPHNLLTHSFKEVASDSTNANDSNKAPMNQSVDSGNREPSLEEISLRLINSIMTEKSELEQQCTEMVEMQNGADINLQTVGFTYPEETSTDSLQQLKQHDIRLSQTKDTLLHQQVRLKRAIRSLRKTKKVNACKNCRQNANKTMCQIGTQFDSDDSLRENGATQTSLPPSTSPVPENRNSETLANHENSGINGQKVCPLCGACYGTTTTFETFHEHVISHFTKEKSLEGFEIVH